MKVIQTISSSQTSGTPVNWRGYVWGCGSTNLILFANDVALFLMPHRALIFLFTLPDFELPVIGLAFLWYLFRRNWLTALGILLGVLYQSALRFLCMLYVGMAHDSHIFSP